MRARDARRRSHTSQSTPAHVLLVPVHRLPPLPALPRASIRAPFPVIAVVAPVVGAVVIGLLTGSPFVLVFALLSPLIAIATTLDARRVARRTRRDEAARFERECGAYEVAIVRAHAGERVEADARHPVLVSSSSPDLRQSVRLGTGPAMSGIAPDEFLLPGDSVDEERLRDLLARARQHASLPVLVPRGTVYVRGTGMAAEALIRRLEHEPGMSVVCLGSNEHAGPEAVVVHVLSATRADVSVSGGKTVAVRPELLSRHQLAAVRARRSAVEATTPPNSVGWRAMREAIASAGDDRRVWAGVPVGLDGSGPVLLDLEREGPHALVGGTTGSGKSEFLRALALGWAADRSPSELHLLFVDFKGGATFAGLTELPHTVGLVTDLDPLVAERALLSLRAELRRRERVLVDAGLRDVTQRPGVLARLVVLVDEFQALIDTFPELHAPFADLSARGRSLGVHLVLCTQNPAGAVRDAVAANCAVRIAFRLTNSAGSGFIGTAGRELMASPPGRAMIVTADETRAVQIATVDDDDIAAVRRRWAGARAGASPWLLPLPTVLSATALEVALQESRESKSGRAALGDDGAHATPMIDSATPRRNDPGLPPLVFGLLDDPVEQRRIAAVWHPARHGTLAVVGASRSGRSTALAALVVASQRVGVPTVVLPGSVTEAWALLEQSAEQPVKGGLLVADDLELLIADADELAPELLVRWDAAVRSLRRVGGAAVAAIGSASAARSLLGARFESRLLLRCIDANDHHLAGAPRGLFDRSAPAGRGWWADRQVQVVESPVAVLVPTPCPAPDWLPPEGRDVVVVTRRTAAVAAALRAAHPELRVVIDLAGEPAAGVVPAAAVALAPRVLVADPEAWQAAWSLFSVARRASPVVMAHADPVDVRTMLGHRAMPPPLDEVKGDVWVVEPGEPVRRRRWSVLAAG